MMRPETLPRLTIFACLALCGMVSAHPMDAAGDGEAASKPMPRLENLLEAVLEGVEGTEIVVSRVSIPPNTSLPKHWHPGEEFAYVLAGSVVLWQEGKDDITGRRGDVLKVPLKQVHTAYTNSDSATVLVFRVHEQGQPERVLVDDGQAPE